MAQNTIETSYNTTASANNGYNSANALSIRLETSGIIENIEMFLTCTRIKIMQDEDGNISQVREKTGEPLANEKGIHALLNFIQTILNPQVVQGNFPADGSGKSLMYEDFVFFARCDLAKSIITNQINWEICDENCEFIIDCLMNVIEPFMTRLIDNKERESYDNTVKHVEHNTMTEGKQQGIKIFGN